MSQVITVPEIQATVDPRAKTSIRVRAMNIASGRYLSIEGDENNWGRDDASLAIRDWIKRPPLESPQVWTILQYRQNEFTMINQYSKAYASIRARSKSNEATVTQSHDEYTPKEPFQQWKFEHLENGYWLIRNLHSSLFVGPQGRSTKEGAYCIQWANQTKDSSYQEWVFEEF